MTSATKYSQDTQLCCFSVCASSGQLGIRDTVVSAVFTLGPAKGVAAEGVSSAIVLKARRRKGFHRVLAVVLMAAGLLRHAVL